MLAFVCSCFPNLTSLDVGNNPALVNVPSSISHLLNLKFLDVSGCQNLCSFPDEILDLKNTLHEIVAKDCTEMMFPSSSIVQRGAKEIYNFIEKALGQSPLKRVKVLFLGNGRTGKTSLLSALAKQPLRPGDAGPDSTLGVNVNTLENIFQRAESWYERLPDITFWDFAGQLEYSAAHDFFMSSRQAVYVIVFSVMEDRESRINQVSYWLRTVATRASAYVRFLIVGTKVDMIEASGTQGDWNFVEKQLEGIEADMKIVVQHCCGEDALLLTKFQFVTSMGTHSQYERLRRELKKNLKEFCKSIFTVDANLLRKLRFPKEYIQIRSEILKLSDSVSGLPMIELKSISQGTLKDAHKSAQMMGCLRVLHDVGDLIFYEGNDEVGGKSPCICWKPQLVAEIIAQFADPDRIVKLQRGCAPRADLETILAVYLKETKASWAKVGSKGDSKYPDSSVQRCSSDVKKLFEFLLDLRVFVPVLLPPNANVEAWTTAQYDSSIFMVPSALKGRPGFWREVLGAQTSSISSIRGIRYICLDRMITVAAFVRAMTSLCTHPMQMWGCAFLIPMHNGGYMFVRLAESRAFIDVVLLGSELDQLCGDSVHEACAQVAMMLRCNMTAPLWLCPQCCASDMFARSGNAHAFYREQLFECNPLEDDEMLQHVDLPLLSVPQQNEDDRNDTGTHDAFVLHQGTVQRSSIIGGHVSTLSCSRFHEVSEIGILQGQSVGAVGGNGMPILYPTGSENITDSLPWNAVTSFGVAEFTNGSGEVLPHSFFALSKQLNENDLISAESMRAIDDAVRCRAESCVVHEATLPLRLKYSIGDKIDSNVIQFILPCSRTFEIKSCIAAKGFVTTKRAHGLSADDEVILSVRFEADASEVEGIHCKVTEIIKDDQLVLKRVYQASDAALPLVPDITIMTINSSFSASDNVLVVFKRTKPTGSAPFLLFPGATNPVRILRLKPNDCSRSREAACWREVEDNWAIMLGNEFQNYEITGMTLFRCEERARLFLEEVEHLKKIVPHRPAERDFHVSTDLSNAHRLERARLQQQVMGHFSDFSQKFSLLPVAENTDVNLSVAWWGKWPAVYHGVAQNGFWDLPSHLKLDPGYFGQGFYLTRYPRYSDYYINDCRSHPNLQL